MVSRMRCWFVMYINIATSLSILASDVITHPKQTAPSVDCANVYVSVRSGRTFMSFGLLLR